MANAMEILGDNKIIDKVFQGYFLKIHPTDDEVAILIKKYIIDAYCEAVKYEIEYKAKLDQYWIALAKWDKHGNQKNKRPKIKYWNINYSKNLVELKVNHYRQKYWYWKKLK